MSDCVALETRGLTRRYGASCAVAGVSLRVPTGSIHGLLGPNGAGKTTLIAMLLGLARPDAGSVHVAGARVTPFRDGLPREVAAVLDGPRFRPHLSGRANLSLLGAYDARPDGRPAGRRLRRADPLLDRLLEEVGLAGRADEPVRGYSLGMRQRLGLAAALLRRPRVLILDEPANGLDPAGVAQVSGLLRRLQVDGVSVLLSSHDLDQVEDLCDEITVLRRGVVAYQGSVEDLRRAAPAPTVLISTSDDERAVAVGGRLPQVHVRHRPGSHGAGTSGSLLVKGGLADVDGYVVQLGRSGIAVRAMSVERTSLHAAFLALTVDTDPAGEEQPQAPTAGRKPRPAVVMAPGASS